MVFDMRELGVAALKPALLRPKRNKVANTVASLASAKLNPVEPKPDSRTRAAVSR